MIRLLLRDLKSAGRIDALAVDPAQNGERG
jgi:hypothetical protein